MPDTAELVRVAQDLLREAADPGKAPAMAAYMKTSMPFYGVQKPARAAVLREINRRFAPASQSGYEQAVLALWALPHREEKYLAIDYAVRNRPFITLEALPLYERLIREGAWWDLVDPVAVHLVGRVLHRHREAVEPVLESWSRDPDLWIRRSCLIAHNTHKGDTHAALLFRHCLRLAPEKEFFIRKAIGWALREYSKTRPEAVARFLAEHGDKLSGLSFREAAKHLPKPAPDHQTPAGRFPTEGAE